MLKNLLNCFKKNITIPSVSLSSQVKIQQVFAGYENSFASLSNGLSIGWGNNLSGKIVARQQTNYQSPKTVCIPEMRQISSSVFHTLAIDLRGSLWGWGKGSYAEMNLGPHCKERYQKPCKIKGLEHIIFAKVVAGYRANFAIDVDGNVWGWGSNEKAQLAYELPYSLPIPVIIPSLTRLGIVDISLGSSHGLALSADGSVWNWGECMPRLSPYETVTSFLPREVSIGKKATQIVATRDNSYVLLEDGEVLAWGCNSYGQVGLDYIPANVIEIAATDYSFLALFADGSVWECGNTGDKRSGWRRGGGIVFNSPYAIEDGSGKIQQISAGKDHVLALDSAGNLWGWGRNTEGQLLQNVPYISSPIILLSKLKTS